MCASTRELAITVEGMSCGSCELTVQEQLEELAGIESARADRATGRVVITGPDVSADAVRTAVAEAGYEVSDR